YVRARLFGEQSFPAGPGVVTSLLVGVVGVGRFAGTHETVAGAIVGHRIIGFSRRFHRCNGVRNGGVNTRVIAGVKTVDGRLDARQRIRWWGRTVENKGGGEIAAIGG